MCIFMKKYVFSKVNIVLCKDEIDMVWSRV